MSGKTIFIGLGILAVGGLAFWYLRKPSGQSGSADANLGTPNAPIGDLYSETGTASGGAQTASKSRKAVRRDCRAEAKAQGLKGREKRQFKRACKAAGGINADTADFAFNGFDGDFEFA